MIIATGQILLGQCPSKVCLNYQKDVDEFIQKYGQCTHIDSLIIPISTDVNDQVVNLDSLKNIKSIGRLEIRNNSSLVNIEGLSALRKVSYCFIHGQKRWKPFARLDSLGQLIYELPSDSLIDLRLFKNLKYIERNLNIIGNAKFLNMGFYRCGESFGIDLIRSNRKDELAKLLPINYENVYGIRLFLVSQLMTNMMPVLINLETVDFQSCRNVDLSGIVSNVSLKSIDLISCGENIDFGTGFQTASLDVLLLWNNRFPLDLEKIFPKLKEILVHVNLGYRNDSLSIEFFDKFDIPSSNTYRGKWYYQSNPNMHIIINECEDLNTCESDYLCRAFKIYPDSIQVH